MIKIRKNGSLGSYDSVKIFKWSEQDAFVNLKFVCLNQFYDLQYWVRLCKYWAFKTKQISTRFLYKSLNKALIMTFESVFVQVHLGPGSIQNGHHKTSIAFTTPGISLS